MKPPKRLYPSTRIIYHPEVATCPLCGGGGGRLHTRKSYAILCGVPISDPR